MGSLLRILFLLIFSLTLILATLVIVVKPKVEPWLEDQIRFALKEACPSCEFSMESLEFSWHGFGLKKVHFSTGPGQQRFEGEIATVYLYPHVENLWKGKLKLQNITFDQPKMVFFDEGEKTAKKKSESQLGLPPDLHFQIDDGEFTYIRDVKNTHAELTLEHIQALIGPDSDGLLRARAKAQLGPSKDLSMTISANLQKSPMEAVIEMRAQDQDMKVLSEFFEPNAGVQMEGILVSGDVRSVLKGSHVSTELRMEFKDFKLQVKPMYDRDGVQTFFTNLAASVALRRKNIEAREKEKTRTVEAEREPNESIVSLVLRSWKEAALKIAQ